MGSAGDGWALREALLLTVEEERYWLSLHHAVAATQCEMYVTTRNFPAFHSGASESDDVLCLVTKVITKIHCSLSTFNAFIATPHNVRYYENGVIVNESIHGNDGVLWMRTIYRHLPPVDVVTLHQSKMYNLSEELATNELLQLFVNNVVNRRRCTGTCTTSREDESNATSPFLPSAVYVYAFHSPYHKHEDVFSAPLSPNSVSPSECVRGWVHLSAFVAYETPGPCVRLIFIHASDDRVSDVMGACERKVGRVRNLCEMLQQMMRRGALTLPRAVDYRVLSSSSPEPRQPSCREEHRPCVPGRLPTRAQLHVLRPLLGLHKTATWRPVCTHEGCGVEECEARQCIAAPHFLKAYRISTSIECSMATFFCLVGDPLQMHRYEKSLDNVSVIESRKEGEVVYERCKPLAAHTSPRDYCVLVTSALLQPSDNEKQESDTLLSFGDSAMTMMVYLQNATQSNHRPCCEGYERQLVYVFGYIATNTINDTRVQVHHIVCIDSADNSDRQLEMAMIQEHCTRMALIRQICENSQGPAVARQLLSVDRGANCDCSNQDVESATFINAATLEDSSSSFFCVQGSNAEQSHPCSLASFEEIEGVLEPGWCDKRVSSRSASSVNTSRTSVTKSDERTTSVTRGQMCRPNTLGVKGKREVARAQRKNRASSESMVSLRASQSLNAEDFLDVDIQDFRNLTKEEKNIPHVICFTFCTAAVHEKTVQVDFGDKMALCNRRVCFEGPQGDRLSVMATMRTATGHVEPLGTAIISLRNVRESVPRTRWVALVENAGKSDARVCCEVCLTLRGGGQNARAEVVPMTEEEEEALRQRIRQVLLAAGCRDLHRLEWLVGRCCEKPPHEIDALLMRYQKRQRPHEITLTVFDVQGLLTDKGLPLLNSPTCQVWVSTSRASHHSRVVPLQQIAVFKESFRLTVGPAESIRITVVAGGVKVGRVHIAACLHKQNVRSHTLFHAAGTKDAMPSGIVTVALFDDANYDDNYRRNCVSQTDLVKNENRLSSLRLLLSRHFRASLHKLDVIAASEYDVDHYMNAVDARPARCNLCVSVKRWDASVALWDSPAAAVAATTTSIEKECGGGVHASYRYFGTGHHSVYAVIHVGLSYYKTHTVRISESGSAHLDDSITFHGVLPGRDEVLVAVVGKDIAGGDEVDLGVAVFPLKAITRQRTMMFTASLVRLAGSGDAYLKGSLQVELLAMNFGERNAPTTRDASFRAQIQRVLYQHAPQYLHRVECLLVEHAEDKERFLRTLARRYGPDTAALPMEVQLIGIRDFKPACSCYVKVYLNGETVLRSSHESGSANITFAPNNSKNTSLIELCDPQHARLRFKVARYHHLQSTTLAVAEIRLRNMLAGPVNECWVPLFDSSGDELGHLGVALRSNGFLSRRRELEASEHVEKDVASLLQKYKPEALPFLQPLMTETKGVKTAHAEIRCRVAPRPIAATVYFFVESIFLKDTFGLTRRQRQNAGEKEFILTASCDHESGCVVWPTPMCPSGGIIRLDIPDYDKRGDHSLTIEVQRTRDAQSLPRADKKSRSTSRGSHTESVRQTFSRDLSLSELGCVVVSLRALLTPGLYDTAERVTLPLVSCTQSPDARASPRQKWFSPRREQNEQTPNGTFSCSRVVGAVTFSVRLPTHERLPSWMRLSDSKMQTHAALDRAYIRNHEERIRSLLEEQEPQGLLDLHYTLYERHVAHGRWCFSLRDWERRLRQCSGGVENRSDASPLPSRARANGKKFLRNDTAKTDRSEKMGA